MNRKILIITIIISFIITILCNKTWLIFVPINVDFDILSNGKYNIEVQMNKKDNNEFKKIKKANNDFYIDKLSHITLSVKRVKKVKRLRIIISKVKNPTLITIKNIKLNTIELNNLKETEVQGAIILRNDTELVLKPSDMTIILTYPEALKIRAETKYNIAIFFIIFVLTFLLTYKLVHYTIEFGTIYKKEEIIFLIIFFIFLFVPMANINKNEISKQENRVLTKFHPLINKDGVINLNFPKEFDAWFNDRFNLRATFIDEYNNIRLLNKNWKTKNVLKGKDNWFFLAWNESKDSFTNQNLFTDDELKTTAKYLSKIENYCRINNKHFYFLIAPDKARIYPEYYPDDIRPANLKTLAGQIVDYLNKNTKVNVIYPKDVLISNKKDSLLYYKQDTHWTLLGSYIGYLELMKKIKKDYRGINIYEAKRYVNKSGYADLYYMAPKKLREKDDVLYKIPDIDNNSKCYRPNKNSERIVICYNEYSNIDALIYRDSFTTFLMPYYTESFKKAKYIWDYDINLDAIKDYDVIILEVVERLLPKLKESIEENANGF